METISKRDRRETMQVKRKNDLDNTEDIDGSQESPTKSLRKQSELDPEEIILERNEIRKKKKEMVVQLLEARQILGAAKPINKEEADLEKLIFGCNPEELEDEEEDLEEGLMQEDSSTLPEEKSKEGTLLPAWEDEDDDTFLVKTKTKNLQHCHRSISLRGEEKYSDYVQEKFINLMGAPKWAEIGREKTNESDDEGDELLQKTGNFIKKTDSLPKDILSFHKCQSLIDASMKSSLVNTVEFLSTSKVALVATRNGTVNLFQIDGKINAKIQSIHFKNFPIETSHFTVDGKEFIVGSSSHAYLFSYDMYAGKIIRIPEQKEMEQRKKRRFLMSPDGKYIVIHGRYGNIHLMTTNSKEWIGTLKMNGEVKAITFNQDGSKMYSHGGNGEVYVWDMFSRKCIHKFVDLGCIDGTALAISPNEQFLATGSDSGIVNIYDHKSVFSTTSPEPLKFIKNLTTEITDLKFNNTSELLSMSSNQTEQAVKLVHFPSLTVFSNFPMREFKNSFKYPRSVDFSTNSGYYCVGSNMGQAHVFRLKHYNNY